MTTVQLGGSVKDCSLEDWAQCSDGVRIAEQPDGARGLVSAKPALTLLTLPWSKLLSPKTALRRLRIEEKAGRSLLVLPVAEFMERYVANDFGVEATKLLLALQLVCELRLGSSSRCWPWIRLLPSSPGSLIASITTGACSSLAAADWLMCAVLAAGPASADLLMFSPEQLQELQDHQLANQVSQPDQWRS